MYIIIIFHGARKRNGKYVLLMKAIYKPEKCCTEFLLFLFYLRHMVDSFVVQKTSSTTLHVLLRLLITKISTPKLIIIKEKYYYIASYVYRPAQNIRGKNY